MGLFQRLFGKGNAVPQVQRVQIGGELREVAPENDLENALLSLRAGQMQIQDVAGLLVKARVFIPSPQDVEVRPDKAGFQPLVVEVPEGLFVPVYTSVARSEAMKEQNLSAASGIETEAAWFVKNMPAELGLFINPGWQSCLMLPAATLATMRTHFEL